MKINCIIILVYNTIHNKMTTAIELNFSEPHTFTFGKGNEVIFVYADVYSIEGELKYFKISQRFTTEIVEIMIGSEVVYLTDDETRNWSKLIVTNYGSGDIILPGIYTVGSLCVIKGSLLETENGEKIAVEYVKNNTNILCSDGIYRKISYIVVTNTLFCLICRIGKLGITLNHPVYVDNSWILPKNLNDKYEQYSGSLYSFVMEENENDRSIFGIMTNEIPVIPLGHGNTINSIITHPFYGDRNAIMKCIGNIEAPDGKVIITEIFTDEYDVTCGFTLLKTTPET